VNRKTGEIKPPTLTGGSSRPRLVDNAGKDGHGFNLISGVTQTGLPIAARLTSLREGEGQTAREILEEDWPKTVAPHLEDDVVRVMASDGAYSGGHFRKAVQEAGFIPNCHSVSHARRKRSSAYAKGRKDAKLTIQYHPNWFLNGLQELSCACGEGKTMRRAEKKADGAATARLEGSCPNCGPISLTAGQWRFANNKKSVSRMLPGDRESVRDWRVGNPLTYHDPLSAEYGTARFGHQEGFHGALVTRFGLLKEKSWYRDRRQAERDVLQVFCAIHAIAMEQRRRAAGGIPIKSKSGPPPPLALAA